MLDEAEGTNRAEISQEVIATIDEVTTTWEREAKGISGRQARMARMERAFPKLLAWLLAEMEKQHSERAFPVPTDHEWWRRTLRAVIADLEDEEQARPPIPETVRDLEGPPEKPLAVPAGDVVDLAQRTVIHCTMGQGVVADLRRYTLYSDQFSSCSPVVMFNEDTRLGGLFHYAAASTVQFGELADMYHRIEPTLIAVNRRAMPGTSGQEYDDYESLMRFFVHRLGVGEDRLVLIAEKSSSFAVSLDEQDEMQLTASRPSSSYYDVTHEKSSRMLNAEVALLVNLDAYSESFATER